MEVLKPNLLEAESINCSMEVLKKKNIIVDSHNVLFALMRSIEASLEDERNSFAKHIVRVYELLKEGTGKRH